MCEFCGFSSGVLVVVVRGRGGGGVSERRGRIRLTIAGRKTQHGQQCRHGRDGERGRGA